MTKIIGRLALLAALAAIPAVGIGQMVTSLNAPATTDQLATLQAQIPQPSDAIPPADMAVAGEIGLSARYRRVDDQAPRISRTVSGTTGSSGTGAVTWSAMPSIPKLTVTPYVATTTTQVPTCYPVAGTVTTTGATIKCFQTQTLLALGLLPMTVAPAGISFDVLALPPSTP